MRGNDWICSAGTAAACVAPASMITRRAVIGRRNGRGGAAPRWPRGAGGVRWAHRHPMFLAYVDQVLAPTLRPATWWCWTASPSTNTRRCARRSNPPAPILRFLPPYSPDFNPIEQAFAKLKAFSGRTRTADLRRRLRPIVGQAWASSRRHGMPKTMSGTAAIELL